MNRRRSILLSGDSLKEGMIAHYPLISDANDISGNDIHGTVIGGTFSATNRFGITNSSYISDGSNGQYIDLLDPNALKITAPLTISLWFNQTEVTGFRGIFAWGGSAGSNELFCVQLNSDGSVRLRHTVSSTSAFYNSGTSVYSSGQWTHLVMERSSESSPFGYKLYLGVYGGSLSEISGTITGTVAISYSGSQRLSIAKLGVLTGFNFNGALNDIYVYNRILATNEKSFLHTN